MDTRRRGSRILRPRAALSNGPPSVSFNSLRKDNAMPPSGATIPASVAATSASESLGSSERTTSAATGRDDL